MKYREKSMFDAKKLLTMSIKNICKEIDGESYVFSSKSFSADFPKYFEFGSITKTYTAIAICSLINEGMISLSDKVSSFIGVDDVGCTIDIEGLLLMKPAIPDYINKPKEFFFDLFGNFAAESEFFTYLNDLLNQHDGDKMKKLVLNHAVRHLGKRNTEIELGYSNTNYFLLGYIIEKVTGYDYFEYLKIKAIKLTENGDDESFGITWPACFSYSSCGIRGTFSDLVWLYDGIIDDRWGYQRLLKDINEAPAVSPSYLYGIKKLGNWYFHDGKMPTVQTAFFFNMEKDICICAYGKKNKSIVLVDSIFKVIRKYEMEGLL